MDLILAEILSFILLSWIQSGISRPVELIWGIEELQTPIGKFFNFTIPQDAFGGDIADINVTETGHSSLPAWLTFDPQSRQFTGWPVDAKSVGPHYIAVTVIGVGGESVEDILTIVVQDAHVKSPCSSEAGEWILTLLLDLIWDSMTMPEKMELLGKFSSYMDVPVGDFNVALNGKGPSALFDSTAYLAGPGNAREAKNPGIKLSTVVECNSNSDAEGRQKLTTFVEEAARDGSMATFTGVDVLGWSLTTTKPLPSRRIRRQDPNFLNTPEPSPVQPTISVRPSGAIQATPYMSVPTGGLASDYVRASAGLHPSPSIDVSVTPTSVPSDYDSTMESAWVEGAHPTVPTPPLPPPGPYTKKPGTDRDDSPGPKPGKPIGNGKAIVAVGGTVFRYQIPKDAFVTMSGTESTVKLLEESEKNSWIKLERQADGVNVLHGLPLADSKGERDYHLDVTNLGKTIQIPFKIKVDVADDSVLDYNQEAEVVLNDTFDEFNIDRRLKFVDCIAAYYRDPDSKHIVIKSIKSGSTVITWSNSTHRGGNCNEVEFAVSSRPLVTENGTVNPDFQKFAKDAHGFTVDKVAVRPIGPCAVKSNIYLSTVVPIVVVLCLILIGCCVGCILYKKRRRGKMTPEPEIFSGKNKPVILKGELGENGAKGNNSASKKPAVQADERAPVAPPQYPGHSPTPGYGRHQEDSDREEQQALLHMPPASVGDGQPRLQLKQPSARN